jgi:hypothetical protein
MAAPPDADRSDADRSDTDRSDTDRPAPNDLAVRAERGPVPAARPAGSATGPVGVPAIAVDPVVPVATLATLAERPPERVRVVLADVARARRSTRVRAELREQSQVGEALVRSLVRTQLSLALRLSVVVAVGLGGLPLLFAVAPAVAAVRPFGIALPWLLLGIVAYPFLFAVGATYVWLSERTEAEFAELVDRK